MNATVRFPTQFVHRVLAMKSIYMDCLLSSTDDHDIDNKYNSTLRFARCHSNAQAFCGHRRAFHYVLYSSVIHTFHSVHGHDSAIAPNIILYRKSRMESKGIHITSPFTKNLLSSTLNGHTIATHIHT